MDTPTKRRRTEISIAVKKSICQYRKEHQKVSQDRIVQFVKETHSIDIGRSTISDILKHSDKWLAYDVSNLNEQKSTRITQAKHVDLEAALNMWMTNALTHNVAISDDILLTKAKKLGKELDVTEFSYSRGWLARFKKRHGVSQREKHGESASADADAAAEGRVKLNQILKDYSLRDIFSFEETGLFYRLEPNKTLASGPVKGTKKCKDRISLGLCANADGSEKLMPVLIHKAKKSRSFSNGFNPQNYVEYYSNTKAWMTSVIFEQFVDKLERKMRRSKRKIILLVDNAPSLSVQGLDLCYVCVEFLPPNTTSEIQPMNAGIIRNFKVNYKRRLMQHYVDCLDNNGAFERINLKQAIYFTHDTWKHVKQTTVANCYRHTGILPSPDNNPVDPETVTPPVVLRELRILISDLALNGNPCNSRRIPGSRQ